MAFDKDAFLTTLDSMTVMELNDLVKAIEEKFGVSAAAMAAPARSQGYELRRDARELTKAMATKAGIRPAWRAPPGRRGTGSPPGR